MGKAITEIDSYAGPMSGTTKLPVSDGDTLQAGTASQVLTYIVANLGDAATKSVGTAAGTVAAGDHTHSGYAATGAIGSSGLTMATARLLGRSTASTGAIEEISLSGLTLSGGVLTASGGSPGGSTTQVQYNNSGAFAGASGITTTGTELAIASGTQTTSKPVIDLSQTWNAAGQTMGAEVSNVTDTASAAGSYLRDWRVNGASKVRIRKDGSFLLNNAASFDFGQKASNYFMFSTNDGSYNFAVSSGGASASRYNVASYAGGPVGAALEYDADGVAKITNGSSGSAYRDIKLRNLIGTGNLATGIVAKTADYTATTSDGTIEVDASGAARTITLFAASSNAGKIIVVKKTDSSGNAVTVDGNASETIDGATTISLASQYSTAILQVNAAGTGWNKLGGV